MIIRKHHINGRRKGNHGAHKRRRAYPAVGAREGAKYGVRGNMQHKPDSEKGKK